jgi:hypothetical protein
MFLQNSIRNTLYGVNAEAHRFNAFWIANEVMKWRGVAGQGLAWISTLGNLISHTTFHRNEIYFSI